MKNQPVNVLIFRFVMMAFLIDCSSSSSSSESSSSSQEKKDQSTGATITVPEGRDDVAVEEGAAVANDTTGAYLTLPFGIKSAGVAVNISSTSNVTDSEMTKWKLALPYTNQENTTDQLVVFYHAKKESGKTVYGVLPKSSLQVSGDQVSFVTAGLGNYQAGWLPGSLDQSKEVDSSDEILSKKTSSLRINASFVDSNGKIYVALERNYLFVSTDGGQSFSQLDSSAGVKSIIVRDVIGDASNNIYLATGLGVAVSTDQGKSFSLIGTDQGLPTQQVNAIAVSGSGSIYAATNKGLAVSTDKTTFAKTYTTSHGLGSDVVHDVFVDGSNNVYAATSAGLSILSSTGSQFANYSRSVHNLANDVVLSVAVKNSWIWAGTANGLSYKSLTDEKFTKTIQSSSVFKSPIIQGLMVTDSNRVYAATLDGLVILDIASSGALTASTIKTTDDGLPDKTIKDVFVSSSSDVYASTDGGLAIMKSSESKFTGKTFTK